MFKVFFLCAAILTMVLMGFIGEMGKVKTFTLEAIKPSPVMIDGNGSVSFSGRVHAPKTIYEIQRAIQRENTEKLNEILYNNQLYIAPTN